MEIDARFMSLVNGPAEPPINTPQGNEGGDPPVDPPATPPADPPVNTASPIDSPLNPQGNEGGDPPVDPPVNTTSSIKSLDEYDESKVLDFFKLKKGKEIKNIDDLFKEPEIKTVNPYEKISAEIKSFLDYHIETGRNYNDFIALQKDISTIPDIDLARERVRLENGNNWNDSQIDSYLERKLGIDLSNMEEMDVADQIELKGFAKIVRDQKLSEQEKYKQPIQDNLNPQQQLGEDMIQLENGQVMKKTDYNTLLIDRQNYLDGLKSSSENIKESMFSIKVDDKGSEKTLNYSYEFSAEDKHNMLSMANDLQKTIKDTFGSENGFKHAEIVEAMFWINPLNREKAIAALIHKAIAENTESLISEIGNVRLGQKDMPTNKDGKKIQPILPNDGFGVKFNFNTQP